ncbi:MAG: hypothetical protein QFB87_00205 [Patescibacteria group bacterium]|nr:hypothetical protein [Patescibacteria group bacterium]
MRTKLHKDQSGLASLVIAILIIIILSTIVTGFLQIIRHEQRRSLDRQLSSQAFYAAESGVNDAVKAINEQGFSGDKTTCQPYATGTASAPTAISGKSNMLTANGSVKYTCLLIDQSPGSIEYKSIRPAHATAFPVTSANGVPVSGITLSWRDTTAGYDKFRPVSDISFTSEAKWNSTGLLKVDIVPADTLDRNAFISNTKTYYLYPNASNGSSTGTIDYGSSNSGDIVDGQCTGTGDNAKCSVSISGLPSTSSYVRVTSMYRAVSLKVTGTTSVGSAITDFKDVQVQVDVTGQAADVTRRIQVRLPHNRTDVPDYSLSSMDTLCKRFLIVPRDPGLPNAVLPEDGDSACAVTGQ